MSHRTNVKLLSIGAGGAFIEACLQVMDHYQCTIIDFPETIKINRDYYEELGFRTIGIDINDIEGNNVEFEEYDIILSLENIEHIPKAPSSYLRVFVPYLKSGGLFVVSSLNLGGINRICHLLLLRPFLADPELFFSPTSFDCEGVHRREYMACEIVEEMKKAGLIDLNVRYTNNSTALYSISSFLQQLICVIPRFRIVFIVSGELS